MMKFTALRRANGNKFPAIPMPRNALPPKHGAPQSVPHLDYYRASKEQYLHRRGRIAQEQVLVHKMLQQQILAAMSGADALKLYGRLAPSFGGAGHGLGALEGGRVQMANPAENQRHAALKNSRQQYGGPNPAAMLA